MAIMRFERARRHLKRALGIDRVAFGAHVLPPNHMRYCGKDFRSDEVFLSTGMAEAARLIEDFGMSKGTALLEIGCGPGRLPIGILAAHGPIRSYDGVDIDVASIDWCNRYITRRHPEFRFHHVEARHERYNPDARPMSEGFCLPFEDRSFNVIYLHSVFANMNPDDIAVYCAEFARLLVPGGQVFLTAFVEESVNDFTVNPQNYIIESEGPMNVARYEKQYFLDLVSRSGLSVSRFSHGADLGGQSVVHLHRAA